jgi:hypothetical protein
MRPIITCKSSPNRPINKKEFDSIRPALHEFSSLDNEILEEKAAGRFLNYSEWYGEYNIEAICQFAGRVIYKNDHARRQVINSMGEDDPDARRFDLIKPILQWRGQGSPSFSGRSGRPWPELGLEENDLWRKTRMVCWMSTQFNEHFIAVLILGPEKLVVPFDSLAGQHVDPKLAEVSLCTI